MCTIIIVHYTATQRLFLFIFPFLQTNITSQMWPTGGKGVNHDCNLHRLRHIRNCWSHNANSNPPQPYLMHPLGVIPLVFWKDFILASSETRMIGFDGITTRFSVSTHYRTATNRRTDGQTFRRRLRPRVAVHHVINTLPVISVSIDIIVAYNICNVSANNSCE